MSEKNNSGSTRNTTQRIKILEYLRSVKTHPTAEDIYKHVKKDLPSITLATVYRNLNLLAKQEEILKLEINGEYHFDGDVCYHQHGVCRKCGTIIDIMQKNITAYAMKHMKEGWQYISVYSCICLKCCVLLEQQPVML